MSKADDADDFDILFPKTDEQLVALLTDAYQWRAAPTCALCGAVMEVHAFDDGPGTIDWRCTGMVGRDKWSRPIYQHPRTPEDQHWRRSRLMRKDRSDYRVIELVRRFTAQKERGNRLEERLTMGSGTAEELAALRLYWLEQDGVPHPTGDRDAVERALRDLDGRIVKRTYRGDGSLMVSTVFTVVNQQSMVDGPPLLYDTAVIPNNSTTIPWSKRSETRAEALETHDRAVAALDADGPKGFE